MEIKRKASATNIKDILDEIDENLTKLKVSKKERLKSRLIFEETIVDLFNDVELDEVVISFKKLFGVVKVDIKAKGDRYHFEDSIGKIIPFDSISEDEDYQRTIRGMIMKGFSSKVKFTYKNKTNIIQVTIGDTSKIGAFITLGSLTLGIILGIILKSFSPIEFNNGLMYYFLSPIKTIILNALSLLMGPLILFSVVACIGQFSDLKTLGKTGAKVMGFYTLTSLFSIGIGYCLFFIFNPGDFGELGSMSETTQNVDFIQTIVGIVPSSFISPFIEGNTMQIIFIAILVGVAIILLGDKGRKAGSFFEAGNELFMKAVSVVTKTIPLFVFVSMCSLLIDMEIAKMGALLLVILYIFIGFILMNIVYLLLVFLIAKRNPFTYFKGAFACWMNAFLLSSSTGAMPKTMEICDKRLGVDPKVYSFSIPLGATINMDGMTIVFSLGTLFLAKEFGISLSISDYFIIAFTILIVSMSAPGIPGGAVFCLAIVLSAVGIPSIGVAVLAGLFSLLDPFTTANNVMGDVAGTYIVASTSNMMKNNVDNKK